MIDSLAKTLAVIVALIISSFATCGGPPGVEPIRIALAAPLTVGEVQTGQDMRDGALLAIEEANSKGGIGGRKLELIYRDDKGDPDEAIKVAKYFVSTPNIIAVVGHLTSDCSLAAAPIYQQASMAMVAPVSTSDSLTTKGYNNVFRIPIRNSVQAYRAAAWVAKKHYSRIAILDDGGAYGEGIASEFERAAIPMIQPYGGEVVLREHFAKRESDFRPLIANIASKSVDAVYFGATYPAAALFSRQAREAGAGFALIGGDGIYAPKFIELAGDSAEGTVVTFVAPLFDHVEGAPPFYLNFQKRFKHKPVAYSPLAYDATNVIIEALRRKSNLDKETLRQEIHDPDFQIMGVSGPIRFDQAGENSQNQRKAFLYIVRNSRFVLFDM